MAEFERQLAHLRASPRLLSRINKHIDRGLLLGTLALWIGLWPAAVGSTFLFGLAHAYQGAGGVVRTGAFGAVAVLLTVFSGSIYLAVVVHAIVDLSQGRMIAMAVRSANRPYPARPAQVEELA